MLIPLIVCGLGLLALAAPAAAQMRDYVMDVWSAELGLPSSSVGSMAQTPEGYLWIASQNGLIRFDGLRFVVFDPDSVPELTHARVEHLFLDPDGRLWINTYDGSLASWQHGVFRREWAGAGPVQFEAFLAPSQRGESVFVLDAGFVIRRRSPSDAWEIVRPRSGGLVPMFAQDGAGTLWIASNDNRLWRLTDEGLQQVSTEGLAGKQIQCIAADNAGRIWVGTNAEVAVFEHGRFQPMTPHGTDARLDVSLLLFMRDGTHWIVANGRARRARHREWIWIDPAGYGLTGQFRQSVNGFEDRSGGVWFTHYGKGVLHVQPGGRSQWITGADGLPGTRIKRAFEDREGNVWLAIDRGGMVRIHDARFKVFAGAEVAAAGAASVAEGPDGTIWIGSMGRGLQRFRDGVLSRFPLPSTIAGGFVFSVFPDSSGRVWMSADQEDLFYLDGEQVKAAPTRVHGIKSILATPDGTVWLGTKSGLSRLKHGRLDAFTRADGFEPVDVRALVKDHQGAVWIGTGDGTIYRFADGHLTRFRPDKRLPVWSLLADSDGVIWAGTFRGGLLRLQSGQFTRFTTRDGLPSDVLCQVIEDDAGQLWIGSNRGVFRVPKDALRESGRGSARPLPVVSYGRSDGLPTLECEGNYQPSAWKDRRGHLWFATPRGVASVDPTQPPVERAPPALVLEELRIDQQPVSLTAGDGSSRGQETELPVPSGRRRFEFRFVGLSLSAPERVRFRYRLDPLEHAWVEAGSDRTAQYSYLPPGHYRFLVTASYGDGRWNNTPASLSFEVLPHLSETWWFRTMGAIVAFVLVAGAVRYASARRFKHALERLELQRALERDRGRIARDIHDDLGAGLTQITLLSELARREPPEEADGHLGQISNTARELTKAVDEIVWAVTPRHDTLDGLVTYVCQYAQEYLTSAGLQCRFDIQGQLPDVRLAVGVRHNLFLAVKETLNNIAKHARAREVRFRLVYAHHQLSIVIEDDGQGFGVDDVDDGGAARASSGSGLDNLRNRLSAIGGTCAISSETGRGTRVQLSVGLA